MAGLILLSSLKLTGVFGLAILDAFNDAGTFGAFGFLGAYFLISFAAPAYLRKRGELSFGALGIAIASAVLLLVPAVGSVYPVPAWPVNIFPYIFIAYLVAGLGWFRILQRNAAFIDQIKQRIHAEHARAPMELKVASPPGVKGREKITA
jgi:hypothetical protein